MTKKEFRAKCYEILEKHGHVEINGTLFYPESGLLDLFDFLHDVKLSWEENRLEKSQQELTEMLKKMLS